MTVAWDLRRTARSIASGLSRGHRVPAAFGPALLVCCLGSAAFAQSTGTATIAGSVQDASGALVPGASVVATHLATGIARDTVTNERGYYVLPALPVGEYEVRIQVQGFKSLVRRGVVLEADVPLTLNARLELGQIEQQVTVTGTPLLQSASGELSTLVSGLQVSELGLNGRNFSQFLTLGPGVVSRQTGRQMGVGQEGNPLMSIHGGRINNNKFTYDGTLAMDTGGNRGLNLFPPMEAIEEVRIMKSNYGADSGSYGYGLVNVVTKSGGRAFHGSAYEYLRNSALDARNFFAREVSPLKLHNFGYTLGGPVYVPRRYNEDRRKTFFFWSQSWNTRKGPQLVSFVAPPASVFTAQTPSAAMRSGDFRELLPRTIVDPLTRQPFPGNIIPPDRLDPNARLLLDRYYPLPTRAGSPNFVATPSSQTDWREELIRADHHFSGATSVMVRYAQDKWEQEQAVIRPAPQAYPTIGGFFGKPGRNLTAKLTNIFGARTVNEFTFGFSANRITTIPSDDARRPAGLTIPEVFGPNVNGVIPTITLAGFGAIGVGGQLNNENYIYTFRDDFSRVMGKHSLKLGFEIVRLQKFTLTSPNLQGSFGFNGGATGHSVADFLLGEAFSYSEQERKDKTYLFAFNHEFYVQDDWKVSPTLTINLGVRNYYLMGAPQATEKFDRLSTFVPSLYDPARAPQVIASSGEIVPGTGDPLNGLITPTNRQELHLTRGLVKNRFKAGPRGGFAWTPSSDQRTVLRGGYGVFYFWGNNNHENLSGNPPFSRGVSIFNTKLSAPAAGRGASFPPSINAFDTNYEIPTVQHWSLNIQRQLRNSMALSVAYVGTRAAHQEQGYDLNQPEPNLQVANRRISANAVRPFRGYAAINFSERSASSNYHGLEAHLLRRLQRGLMVEVAYTWSKALERQVGQDVRQKDERALGDLDRTHVFVLNHVYQLPWFEAQNGVRGKLLGGWQVSGITTFQSGLPLTVTIPGDRAGVGGGTQRPDLVSTPTRLGRLDAWFDTAAFAPAALGRFGNAGRNIIRGPGISDWSLNVFKNTRVRWFGSGTATAQIGAEFFNVFNHPQFEDVGTVFGTATFGRVLSARDPRIVQFRMKLMY